MGIINEKKVQMERMLTCVKVVASLIANGTSNTRASVRASKVFPEPVGPLHEFKRVDITHPLYHLTRTNISSTLLLSKTGVIAFEINGD